MKYKEQQNLVSDLRLLADFYERPESIMLPYPYGLLHTWDAVGVYDWDNPERKYSVNMTKSKAAIKKIASSIGSCEKNWTSASLEVIKKFGNDIVLRWSVSREAICRKVPTGNKIVIKAQVIPERVEEEFDWVCDDVALLS